MTVYYEPETASGLGKKPHRDFALQLARRGFVALSIGSTESTNNRTYATYYPSIDKAKVEDMNDITVNPVPHAQLRRAAQLSPPPPRAPLRVRAPVRARPKATGSVVLVRSARSRS